MYQLLCYIYPLLICGWNPPHVSTNWSRIEGIKEEFQGKRINTFLGLPYAEPPTGDLRFRPPSPLESSSLLQYYAGNYRSDCLSVRSAGDSSNGRFIDESEDCLYLNVWSPEDSMNGTEPNLKPVLVYLHSPSTDVRSINGKILSALGDLVVVTFNYRLGLFGLIQDGDSSDLIGKAIKSDTEAAINWIKDHIKLFGGDADKLTLLAEGWDAIQVGLTLQDRLVDRLIIVNGPLAVSGDTLDEQLTVNWPIINSVAQSVGCLVDLDDNMASGQSERMSTILDCLRKTDHTTLLKQYGLASNNSSSPSASWSVISPSVWSIYGRISRSIRDANLSLGTVLTIQINTEYDFDRVLGSVKSVNGLLEVGGKMRNVLSSSPTLEEANTTLVTGQGHNLVKWTLRQLVECPLLQLTRQLASQGNTVYSLLVDSTFHSMTSRPSLFRQVDIFSHRSSDLISGSPLLNQKVVHKEIQRLSLELVKIISFYVKRGKAKWPRLVTSEATEIDGVNSKKFNQYCITTEECSQSPDFVMKSKFCSNVEDILKQQYN